MRARLIALLFGVIVAGRAADDFKLPAETAKLKPGVGVQLVTANCLLCHSADYISTQPPLPAAAWRASVEKMRSKYGAPVSTNNVQAIVEYLGSAYGSQNVPRDSKAARR